jgi:endonuclease YncB( thermonuclease family)
MLRLFCLCVCILGTALRASAQTDQWQTLEGCRLLKKESYDGDSFHVKHERKEYIFRLYYVDTPEKKEMELTKRTTEQAKYWNIYKKDLYLLAEQAALFTNKFLSSPFTVRTKWEDARGNSALPRFYAAILDSNQKDLALSLVENGLARIYGHPVSAPDGKTGKELLALLKTAEELAQQDKKGAWALPKKGTKAKK